MISGSALCTSFKLELLRGRQRFGVDDFFIALYEARAPLDPDITTSYITEGEVQAPGYQAGGQQLRKCRIGGPRGRIAFVTFDDPVWPKSSIVARGALIYNQTYRQSAVAILDFGEVKRSNEGNFLVHFPPPSPLTALIRVA